MFELSITTNKEPQIAPLKQSKGTICEIKNHNPSVSKHNLTIHYILGLAKWRQSTEEKDRKRFDLKKLLRVSLCELRLDLFHNSVRVGAGT